MKSQWKKQQFINLLKSDNIFNSRFDDFESSKFNFMGGVQCDSKIGIKRCFISFWLKTAEDTKIDTNLLSHKYQPKRLTHTWLMSNCLTVWLTVKVSSQFRKKLPEFKG